MLESTTSASPFVFPFSFGFGLEADVPESFLVLPGDAGGSIADFGTEDTGLDRSDAALDLGLSDAALDLGFTEDEDVVVVALVVPLGFGFMLATTRVFKGGSGEAVFEIKGEERTRGLLVLGVVRDLAAGEAGG